MCGRYVSPDEAAMEREFSIKVPPDYFGPGEVFPKKHVPIIRFDADGDRECVVSHWGMIPPWAKGKSGNFATFNARSETMTEKATYRNAWRRGQRCLIPAASFSEWQKVEGQTKKKHWHIRVANREITTFGGMWEQSRKQDGEIVTSATIITMPANELMAKIHNTKERMPLILEADNYDAWLNSATADAQSLVRQFPSARMEAWPV